MVEFRAKGKAVEAFVSLADYAPTFLELAGISVSRRFAGRSLVPFLKGENPEGWRTELFTQSNGNELYGIQRAVFDDKYKFVYNGFDFDELYDLTSDPGECHNLAEKEDTIRLRKCIIKALAVRIREPGYAGGYLYHHSADGLWTWNYLMLKEGKIEKCAR